jgi:hypothetical protein
MIGLIFYSHTVFSVPTKTPPKKTSLVVFPTIWPVSGVYMTDQAKDIGQATGIETLNGIKIRGWIDTYYVYNFNNPSRAVVDANQPLSVIKGQNISVEGRVYDVHNQSFQLALAQVEIEKIPEWGGIGFKVGIGYGDTLDVLVDTFRGNLGPDIPADSVRDFDKALTHATISYVMPICKGLRFDVGKFVSPIGEESFATIQNWNYSLSFLGTYAIPGQHIGIRMHYPWTDTFYTEFYIVNGWNCTIDNNTGKTMGPSIGWTAQPWLTFTANYLIGPEQDNRNGPLQQIFDMQVALGPFGNWNFVIFGDYGSEKKAINFTTNGSWGGIAGCARYKVNECFEPSIRVEYYDDPNGASTNVKQTLMGYTLTFNTKIADVGNNKGSALMLRPEIRYDHSSAHFFTRKNTFRVKRDQVTIAAGLTWFF